MPPEPNEVYPTSLAAILKIARETPWKATNEIERLLVLPYARLYFAMAGVPWRRGWRLYGVPIIQRHRHSEMTIGEYMELRSTVRGNPLGANHPCILTTRRPGARLVIGDFFGMTGGSVVCEESITIGSRVIVGCNTVISDTDFHPLDAARRRENPLDGATKPVTIDDDVFIGMNSLILKGVRLGEGCVIGAGSVVTRDVPAGAVAAGVPAQVVR